VPCVEISDGLKRRFGGNFTGDPLAMALHGGDDYELMFAVPRRLVAKLRGAPCFRDLRAIGEVKRRRGIELVRADGRSLKLASLGWDPFRKK
jgi:thiamine monophosphate kinase